MEIAYIRLAGDVIGRPRDPPFRLRTTRWRAELQPCQVYMNRNLIGGTRSVLTTNGD